MSRLHTSGEVESPAFGHAWQTEHDGPRASVDLSRRDGLTFDSAQDARDLAAACIRAAEAIDALTAQAGEQP